MKHLALLACSLGLVGLMPSILGAPAVEELAFDRHEVVTGTAKRQTILTGFLLDGSVADLAVVALDANEDRQLRIYAFSGNAWSPRVDATLGPEVLFVDIANIDGRDRLVSYEPGRLNWLDAESATEHTLVAVTSNFSPPRENEVPHVDITRDVNDDGREDLVVPDADGFRVFIQLSDGAFADPVKIGPAVDLSRILGADGYRYDPWSQSRMHEMDYNLDGRGDLVFWDGDHFEVHCQDEHGLFAPEAETFTTDVAFDSDDLSSLAGGDMTGRVLHSLTDLNGDGVGDLVVVELENSRMSSKESVYEVHYGARAADGGTAFAEEAGATFRSAERIQLGMERHEFASDRRVGLMFTTVKVDDLEGSLWKRLKGAMGDDVVLNLEFYQTTDGLYRDQPNAIHRIALDGAPSHREPGWVSLDTVLAGPTHESRRNRSSWPRAFNRTLLIGDVTGDGRSDLLIEAEFMELLIHVGVPGPDVFAVKPQSVAVSFHDEEYTWLVDLNRDGKQDILTHHPFTLRNGHGAAIRPPGTEPQRVTMLIAR